MDRTGHKFDCVKYRKGQLNASFTTNQSIKVRWRTATVPTNGKKKEEPKKTTTNLLIEQTFVSFVLFLVFCFVCFCLFFY